MKDTYSFAVWSCCKEHSAERIFCMWALSPFAQTGSSATTVAVSSLLIWSNGRFSDDPGIHTKSKWAWHFSVLAKVTSVNCYYLLTAGECHLYSPAETLPNNYLATQVLCSRVYKSCSFPIQASNLHTPVCYTQVPSFLYSGHPQCTPIHWLRKQCTPVHRFHLSSALSLAQGTWMCP